MKIKIHDLSNQTVYIANSINECKDDADKSAYKSAITLNKVITLGCVIAEPVSN